MKQGLKDLCLAILLGIGLPWVLCIAGAEVLRQKAPPKELQITVSEPEQPMICVLTENGVEEMILQEYIAGVVLGEMPSGFALEAKKAQAVAARTYALRVAAGNRHDGAVCTDSGCCQNFKDPASVADKRAVTAARDAAEQTEGVVMTYQGKLIDATYFSCSGGMTEDAVAVWGSDIPYLQSVESPGEEYAVHYTDTVTLSLDAFQKALQIQISDPTHQWLGPVAYTQSGGVETMVIGGVIYKGTQLRKLLGLRSTVFEITATENTVTIMTKGYGHRVGMSQYGADAMARGGSDFRTILQHYYQGVTLEENWY